MKTLGGGEVIGEMTLYYHDEYGGHWSVADGAGWVSALFKSKEAVLSWSQHFEEAEELWIARHTGKVPPWNDFIGERNEHANR